jgi:MscS family membrane protein
MFNDFLEALWYGNTVRAWLTGLAIVASSIIGARIFYFVSTKGIKRLVSKAKGRLLYIFIDMIEEPLSLVIIVAGCLTAQRRLAFPASVDSFITKIVSFVAILTVTWAFARLVDSLITEYLLPRAQKSESTLDDQLLPILRKGAATLIWTAGLVTAAKHIGYDLGAVVAGLGIGGLAFAFAAQDTIGNLFGGITIFVDAPFRIGDRVKITGYEGWVRDIGLRTSKLETLDGRRLTIPNSMFSKSVIENVSSEPATKVMENIGIDCRHDAQAVEKVIDLLKTIIKDDDELEKNSTAFFSDFGESSHNITFVLWIKKGADIGAVRSRVNLTVLRELGAANIRLAVPLRRSLGTEE